MTWTWRLLRGAGVDTDSHVPTTPVLLPADGDLADDLTTGWESRDEAEAWLHDVFADLAQEGFDQVSLLDGTTVIYSMSLTPTA